MAAPKRSTVELVVLIFATTLALVILASVLAVLVVEITHPEVQTRGVVDAIASVLQVLMGAVLGYLLRGSRDAPMDRPGDTGEVDNTSREDPP